jgi:two-component system phosphate regulon response regulator PhoB
MATVLIVDDEASLRFVLRIAFEAAGHAVVEASDGKTALDRVAETRPDVVATDFMMPRMDGQELIARLRGDPATAEMPILLVSSSRGASLVEGADAFMKKPLNPADVVAQAEELLRSRPA